MKYEKTQSYTMQSPEVVMNLWAYADEAGHVLRLAGRTYVMDGDDNSKLMMLRKLSKTDFLSASWQPVSPNFKMKGPGGNEMRGVAHISMLSDVNSHGFLFDPLIDKLTKDVLEQMRSVEGEYERFRPNLPREPLCVTTVGIEREDGRLEPMVSG